LALAGFAPWVAIKMAHFAGVHLEGMHMVAAHATAGASTVQSMARPVGAAVMPGGVAGAAAAVGGSNRWSPQTPANTPNSTESLSAVGNAAQSNLGTEGAASGTTPSTNGSSPSPNGSPPKPDTTVAASYPPTGSTAGADGSSSAPPQTAREFFWQRNQAAARNAAAGWDTPTSAPTPPSQTRPPTTQSNPPKGNPLQ
jgi:type IV secretion system protein TrbL